MKPSRKQFVEYVMIRDSGVTNMFAVNVVCSLSSTGLTKEHCMYIMEHFSELADEYGVEI